MTQRSRGKSIAGAHRTVRSLADGEGPFAGDLVTHGDEVLVRVDAARLAGWPGWRFAGTEHVVAPRDVALRVDGQDALLPWCVRSGHTYLAQRAAEGGLAHGEVVTLAVSVLRGLAELVAADGPDGDDPEADVLTGEWWLTHDARPVFVIGSGESPLASSAGLLGALEAQIEDRALRRVLAGLRAATEEPRRLFAEVARREQELLEFAAPRPLRVPGGDDPGSGDGDLARASVADPRRGADRALRRRDLRARAPRGWTLRGPRAARGIDGRHGARTVRPGCVTGSGSPGASLRTMRTGGRTGVSGAVQALMRRVVTPRVSPGSRPDPRRPADGRRRWMGPVVVAVGAAAVIAVLGAVWPSGTGVADAADRRATASPFPVPAPSPGTPALDGGGPAPSAAPSLPPTPTPEPKVRAPGPSRQQDPLLAATELVAAAQGCARTSVPACAGIWDGADSASSVIRESGQSPVLIEDYGDIAAVRNAAQGQAQMIVIIRRDAEWRIRDVYGIADPPSEGAGSP